MPLPVNLLRAIDRVGYRKISALARYYGFSYARTPTSVDLWRIVHEIEAQSSFDLLVVEKKTPTRKLGP